MQLGGGRNFQATVNGGTNRPVIGTSSFAKRDSESDTLGYAFDRVYGAGNRTSGSVAWRSEYGRLEAQGERVGGNMGFRANARGSIIAAGGAVFARNQTGGSYALVRTGTVSGITVMRENRPAGVTTQKGLLLVENIPAQVPITFDIDPDKLPTDALARDTRKRVIVPRRAVGLVLLDVVRFVPRQIRLAGPDGQPLAPGTILQALPSGEQLMAGFDGVVDFNAGGSDRRLVVPGPGGPFCIAEIDLPALAAASDTEAMPAFECRTGMPGAIAQAEPEPTARKQRLSGGLAARNRK